MERGLTRRGFVAGTGAAMALLLAGCGGSSGGGDGGPGAQTLMYRLSTRGRRASNAAEVHAAHMRFATAAAADAGRAHPGDTSKVVPLSCKPSTWELFFGNGATAIDIRTLPASLRRLAG